MRLKLKIKNEKKKKTEGSEVVCVRMWMEAAEFSQRNEANADRDRRKRLLLINRDLPQHKII
jgi:hypothetical protein